MKNKIAAIVSLTAIIVWGAAGCGCPRFCGLGLRPSTICTKEFVFYHYKTDGVSRGTLVDIEGCFVPDKDSTGKCPPKSDYVFDLEIGKRINLGTPDCP